MFDSIVARFGAIAPQVDFWSLRLVYEVSESLSMRQGILQPMQHFIQRGAFLNLINNRGARSPLSWAW